MLKYAYNALLTGHLTRHHRQIIEFESLMYYNLGMKKFLQYFVLEFIIIFVIGSIGYWILNVPYNLSQILFSSVVSGAIIAFALQTLQKRQ